MFVDCTTFLKMTSASGVEDYFLKSTYDWMNKDEVMDVGARAKKGLRVTWDI